MSALARLGKVAVPSFFAGCASTVGIQRYLNTASSSSRFTKDTSDGGFMKLGKPTDKVAQWENKLSQTHSSNSSENVKDLYDEWVGDYDACLKQWEYSAPKRAVEYFFENQPIITGDGSSGNGSGSSSSSMKKLRLFDLGCGTGLIGEEICLQSHRKNVELWGSDVSEPSLDYIRVRRDLCYDDLSVCDINEPRWDYPTDHFDGLLCAGVLTYATDVAGVLNEMVRITKKDSIIVLTHRTDMMPRDIGYFENLEKQGILTRICRVKDQPYLPKNPNYARDIQIDYYVARNTKLN